MANHVTIENGRYAAVPVPTPLSMELFVVKGETVKEAYTVLKDGLEQQKNYQDDGYYDALYGYFERNPPPKPKEPPTTYHPPGAPPRVVIRPPTGYLDV
ncbi:hypothetical protein AB5N19_06720 [Seiridium cardinale]|uniref:Uncharacterized protein n=1 Tax=Seiridium cardinale TaxID=138064 RepID=A0ABR2XL69_9PEZI